MTAKNDTYTYEGLQYHGNVTSKKSIIKACDYVTLGIFTVY